MHAFFPFLIEPYNFFGRRGQREPQVLAAASVKRLFVENRPHLVGGYCRNKIIPGSCYNESPQILVPGDPKLRTQHEVSASISSMAEKYRNMKTTFRKRLAFGELSSLFIKNQLKYNKIFFHHRTRAYAWTHTHTHSCTPSVRVHAHTLTLEFIAACCAICLS